jgi:hypothetical protein
VAAVVIVVMQPGRERSSALGLGPVGQGVGPFVEQGAVEPLDLAVGLGPVRPGPLVCDRAERVAEGKRAVAGAVVGQDPSDPDAVAGEERLGPGPESGRGLLPLVGANLGVGEPRVASTALWMNA